MVSRRNTGESGSSPVPHTLLPTICVVTEDVEFLDELIPEVVPWFQVVIRPNYADLARWTREARVVAVLLDIDTDGPEEYGGLPVLNELRRLNETLVLISLSRSRTRSVEKQALEAGADAHFRRPVDIAELRLALADSLRWRVEEAAREEMRRQAFESSRFQDFVGTS